jgi:hypothetical protein
VGYKDSTGTVVSPETICPYTFPIVTDLYSGVTGGFCGNELSVKWNNFVTRSVVTQLQFETTYEVYTSGDNSNYMDIKLPPALYMPDTIKSFRLSSLIYVSYGGDKTKYPSFGIKSSVISFYTSQLKLVQAGETISGNTHALAVSFTLPPVYVSDNMPKVYAEFYKDGRLLYITDRMSIAKPQSGTVCNVSIAVPQEINNILYETELILYLCSPEIATSGQTIYSKISLERPVLFYDTDGIKARVDFNNSNADFYFLNIDGDETKCYNDYIMGNFGDYNNKVIKAAPAFLAYKDTIKGLYSEPVTFTKEFFAVSDTNVLYNGRNLDNKIISFEINTEIYAEHLSAEIVNSPYKLTPAPSKAEYMFSIDIANDALFTADNLSKFITAIFSAKKSDETDNIITPYGYYKLRDLIGRYSPCSFADLLGFYCGAAVLSNELLPGFVLKVEAEYYNQQSSQYSDNDNGFVKGAVSEYTVSLNGNNIEFNSCLSNILGTWTSQLFSDTMDFGGLIDLFFDKFKSSYYQVVYPSSFFDSNHGASNQSVNNTCIVSVSPDKLPVDISAKPVFFRGRTSVTTEITVIINENPVNIPLGTTLAKLSAKYGNAKFEVKRQDGSGNAIPVYFTGDASAAYNNFFLFLGDVISIT